jgi:predicted AAA+ superfamily ATPase
MAITCWAGRFTECQGPLLETFVFSEVLKQASWFDESCALYHYQDKDQDEVDLVIETGSGTLVGIEVKAC